MYAVRYAPLIVTIENRAVEDNEKQRTRLRILSYLNLEKLVETEGASWLDKELLGKAPERLTSNGFGKDIGAAMTRRRQWLVAQGLGTFDSTNTFEPQPRMLEQLRQCNQRQASQILSNQLGLSHTQPVEGERVDGNFNLSVNLASGKYAVIQKSKEFTPRSMAARDGTVQRKVSVRNREQSRHQLGLEFEARSGLGDFLTIGLAS